MSDILFSGLENIQPVIQNRLSDCKEAFSRLGMSHGERCIDNFIDALLRFKNSECEAGNAVEAFCVLEFYIKNIRNSRTFDTND